MYTQSQKCSFIRYLAREIIKQRMESYLIFISVLFWLRSIWFCLFTLEPYGTVPDEIVPLAEPKQH